MRRMKTMMMLMMRKLTKSFLRGIFVISQV